MTFTRNIAALLLACFALNACGEATESYLMPNVADVKARSTVVRSIEVTRFDLPSYAEDSQISIRAADGVVRPQSGAFWADAPDRALAEMLSAGLDKALSAQVVSEPWPFNSDPDVKVEVKVRDLIGSEQGMLSFVGQYAISSPAGGSLQVLNRFDYEIPINGVSMQAMADALSGAMRLLTNDIAKKLSQVRRAQL